jgi:hypothetical protein
MCEKKRTIVAKLPERVGIALLQNIWTRVCENPLRFIVARRKEGDICKASVVDRDVPTSHESNGTENKQKMYFINYGATVFRVFPIKVTLHESPLKFLEAPPTSVKINFK